MAGAPQFMAVFLSTGSLECAPVRNKAFADVIKKLMSVTLSLVFSHNEERIWGHPLRKGPHGYLGTDRNGASLARNAKNQGQHLSSRQTQLVLQREPTLLCP